MRRTVQTYQRNKERGHTKRVCIERWRLAMDVFMGRADLAKEFAEQEVRTK